MVILLFLLFQKCLQLDFDFLLTQTIFGISVPTIVLELDELQLPLANITLQPFQIQSNLSR